MKTHTDSLATEVQLSNFFNHYPIEYIEENIANLFKNVIPHPTEHPSISANYLFYEELNLLLKNCELLYQHKKKETQEHQQLKKFKNIDTVVNFLKEVIPTAYIFCSFASSTRIDLIIVMDQYKYKSFEEIYSLLDIAMLGHEHINCTVYTYGTIHEFLSKGHLYFSTLCIPENCVYKRTAHFMLPLLNPDKCAATIDHSSKSFHQNIQKAITFFNGAQQFANESQSTISGFMLQQACELTYRSLLLSLRGKQVKCHDLVVLRKHLSHFVPTIIGVFDTDEEKEVAMLTSIQEAYIKSRYDQNYTISLAELQTNSIATNALIQSAQEIFNYHCQKIKLLSYSN